MTTTKSDGTTITTIAYRYEEDRYENGREKSNSKQNDNKCEGKK